MTDIYAFGENWAIPAPLRTKLDAVVSDWLASHPQSDASLPGRVSTLETQTTQNAAAITTKAPTVHTHTTGQVDGLGEALASRQVVFRPEMYGAKGDGTTDDAQAIRDATAAAAGAPVVFTSGKTYLIGSALAFTGVDVNWASSGVKPAVLFHNGQDFVPLSINGTRNVATTTLTASHAINTYRWQVASSAGVQPGMLVGIVSSKLWYHDNRGATYKSELHRVTKVGAGWIETEDPANDGYDTTTETVTLTFHKPSLTRMENLTLRKVLPPPSDTAKGQDGIRLTGLDSPQLLNVNVENSATSAIAFTECWRPLVDGGYTYSSNDYGTGYGVNTAGTAHAVVRNRKFWECRRGVDFSGAPIISRHNLVENCVHMGGGANSRGTTYGWDETTGYVTPGGFLYGFGTHGGADHTTYRNNTTIANSYAYSCRGRDEKIIGNTMIGRTYRGSIVLSTGAGALIEGNTVIGGWRGGGKETKFWQTGATEGSRTSDFLVYVTKDYEGAADSDVIIRDNNVEVQYNLVRFEAGGTVKHLTVQGNRIRFYPHLPSEPCAVVESLDTAPISVTDWTVAANDYRRMSGTGLTEIVRGVNVDGAVIRDMMAPTPAPTAYQPVELTGTTHLDTVKTPGDYLTTYAFWSKPENGYPAEAYGNGRVEVRSLGGKTLEQRWTPYGRLGVWKRCFNGSTWAVAWHKIETVA